MPFKSLGTSRQSRQKDAENGQMCSKMISSGPKIAIAFMNLLQLWLTAFRPLQDSIMDGKLLMILYHSLRDY